MRMMISMMVMSAVLAGCADLIDVSDDVPRPHHFVRVQGLWDGTDGLNLLLQADGVEELFTLSRNEQYEIRSMLSLGASYTLAKAKDPLQHTCIFDSGRDGQTMNQVTISNIETTTVSINCTGPGTVMISTPSNWISNSMDTSQDVVFTIVGSTVTYAEIENHTFDLNVSRKLSLNLSLPTTLHVYLRAAGGLSKTYKITLSPDTTDTEEIGDCKFDRSSRMRCIPQ